MAAGAPRIAFVVGKDPGEGPGGHSVYARVHALAARRAGFEPHLLCLGPGAETRDTDLGVVHRVHAPWVAPRQTAVPWLGPRLARALTELALAAGGPRILHAIGPVWGWVGVEAAARLARRGVAARTVVSAYTAYSHEVEGRRRGAPGPAASLRLGAEGLWVSRVVDRYERRAVRRSDRVLVNYDSVAALLRARHGGDCAIERVPYTTEHALAGAPARSVPEPPEALRAGGREAVPRLVCVARHDPRKGLSVLLRSLALLRARGVPFRACLVGEGELLEHHRRRAAALGLADRVAIPGRVPDVRPYLQHADVFVLPSLEEGSGSLALLEALEAGLCVVAAGVDGVPEDVAHGESGLLVAPGDPGSLAGALATVLADAALRARLAAGGREAFRRRHAPERLVHALGCLYRDLGARPPGRRCYARRAREDGPASTP